MMACVAVCTGEEDDRPVPMQQHDESKRFMRFGRLPEQQQQTPDDDANVDQKPPVYAKRFMRFGREFMRFGRSAPA